MKIKSFPTIATLAATIFASMLLFSGCSGAGDKYEVVEKSFDELTGYTLMRSDIASDQLTAAVVTFRDGMREAGVELELNTDWVKRGDPIPESGRELLVGTTNRPESSEALEGLRYYDFVIRLDGERIVINAGSDGAIDDALEYFLTELVDSEGKIVELPIGEGYIYRADYPIDVLTLDGVDISEYGIVVENGRAADAESFAAAIRHLTGYTLNTSGEAAHNFVFGDSKTAPESGKGIFEAVDGNIYINGGSDELIADTSKYFLNTVIGYNGIDTSGLDKKTEIKLSAEPTPYDSERKQNMEAINLYVSIGAEGGDGSKAAPFGSIEAALERAKIMRSASLSPITVNVGSGEYFVDESLVIDASLRDFTLKAEDGAKVTLIGGERIEASRISKVTDKAILDRIYDDKARENLYAIDLTEIPISDFKLAKHGDAEHIPTEIYYNDAPLEPGRWPNRTAYDGSDAGYIETYLIRTEDGAASTDKFTVYTKDMKEHLERIAQSPAKDICVHGYFYWQWSDINSVVTSVDPEKGTFTASGTGIYGVKPTDEAKRFYFYNVLEEIDVPGEMYIDRKARVAYFYADGDPTKADIFVSTTSASMIFVSNTSNVTLSGLEFKYSCGRAIKVSESNSVTIDSCKMAHFSSNALTVEHSTDCVVKNNEIYDMGRGGVIIQSCGNRSELISGNTTIINNRIHDVNRIAKSYTPAVGINASFGVNIGHNTIYNSPHLLVQFGGSADITVEYNEIYNAVKDAADMGAIYWGRDTLTTGIRIRNNYFHDSGNSQTEVGINIVYCDDGATNAEIYNNIFYKCGEPGNNLIRPIGGAGQYADIYNNIFIENGISARLSLSPAAYMQFNVIDGKNNNKLFGETGRYSDLKKVGFFTDKWKDYYKGTNWERIWENFTDEYFKYVEDEIKEYGIFDDVHNYTVQKAALNNLFHGNVSISSDQIHAAVGTKYPDENGRVQYVDDAPVESYIYCEGNYTTDTDKDAGGKSIFKKYGEDFTLTDEGLAFIKTKIPSFENIDMSEIGAK